MKPIIRLTVLVLMISLALASGPAAGHAGPVMKSPPTRKACAPGGPCLARAHALVRAGHTTAHALGLAVRETAQALRLAQRVRPTSRPAAAPRSR